MAVRTYDPKMVIITIGGVPMTGYADGTFVSVERASDSFTKVTGADGMVTRSKSNDKSGQITLTLKQSSPSNDVLSGFAALDEMSNTGVFPVSITDLSGHTLLFMPSAWIRKPANVEFGKELSTREWVLDFDKYELPASLIGGNNSIGL